MGKILMEEIKHWTDYHMRGWDIPQNDGLLNAIAERIKSGRYRMHIMDCLAVPGGSQIMSIANAKWDGERIRVMYVIKSGDGSYPSEGILGWTKL